MASSICLQHIMNWQKRDNIFCSRKISIMKNLFVSEDQSNLGIWCYQHILHFAANSITTLPLTHIPQIHMHN